MVTIIQGYIGLSAMLHVVGKTSSYYTGEDQEGDDVRLCFVRNVEGRDLDFVVIRNNKPVQP